MRIARLAIYLLRLPLKREIKHASAARTESTNVLVSCELANGIRGWGEGVPRPYVTGETPEGAVRQFQASPLAEQLQPSCATWPEVISLCRRLQPTPMDDDPRGCRTNSLKCAIELSILDAYGQLLGEPVSRVIEHVPTAEPISAAHDRVRYSGAVTAASRRKEVTSAIKMRAYGFRDCKVKVGSTADEGPRLRRLRWWLGNQIVVRLDANEAWHPSEVVPRMEPLLKYDIASLEQPVPHAEVRALAEIRRTLPVPIMLDESLTSLTDAHAAIADQTCDLFNIRLSKCGGYLASLELAALAHQAGLGYQLGCHPGESGILSAAGRHWATSVAGIRFLEGSYDRHLLKRLVTREDITFRYGGWAPALDRPGLGVTPDPAALETLAEFQASREID